MCREIIAVCSEIHTRHIRNAWTRMTNVNGACRLSNFWNFLGYARSKWFPVAIGDHVRNLVILLWPGDKETIIGVAAHPAPYQKNSECKNPLENLEFLGSRRHPPHWLSSERPDTQRWSITHLCWCQWRIFWRKNAAGRSPRGACSCTTMPRHNGHLQPRRNWPTWASTLLITHPPYSPDLALSDYHLFSGLKKQLKGRHFSSDAEVTATAETWLDGTHNFFWVACKS